MYRRVLCGARITRARLFIFSNDPHRLSFLNAYLYGAMRIAHLTGFQFRISSSPNALILRSRPFVLLQSCSVESGSAASVNLSLSFFDSIVRPRAASVSMMSSAVSAAMDDEKHGFIRDEMYKENLAGTVQAYDRHLFLCFKSPEAWLSRVEDSVSDPLPKLLATALKDRKNDISVKVLCLFLLCSVEFVDNCSDE